MPIIENYISIERRKAMKNEKEWTVEELYDLENELAAGYEEVYAIGEAKGSHDKYKDLEDFYGRAIWLTTAMMLEKIIEDSHMTAMVREAIREKYSLRK